MKISIDNIYVVVFGTHVHSKAFMNKDDADYFAEGVGGTVHTVFIQEK